LTRTSPAQAEGLSLRVPRRIQPRGTPLSGRCYHPAHRARPSRTSATPGVPQHTPGKTRSAARQLCKVRGARKWCLARLMLSGRLFSLQSRGIVSLSDGRPPHPRAWAAAGSHSTRTLVMLKRLFAIPLVAAALAVPNLPVRPVHAQPKTVETSDCTVYVTRTGTRCHRAGCSSLRAGAVSMSRSEAIRRGKTPCKRCGGSSCKRR
jgi:hypothetical protein